MSGLIRVGMIAALLLGARPVQAQVLWRLDTSAAAAPLAGATELKGTEEEGRVVNRSRVDGAGPNGEAVYRFQFRHDPSQMNRGAAWGGEHYLGWFRDVGPVPQTPSVFTRVLFRVMPGSTFQAVDSSSGEASQTIHKIVIVADTHPTRTIISLHGSVSENQFQLQVGRNGGGETKIDGLRAGTWYALQVETVFGAGTSLRVWLNNANQAAPTRTFSGLNFTNSGYNLFMLGYYSNRMIGPGNSYGVEFARVEYATSFDPAFAVGAARAP